MIPSQGTKILHAMWHDQKKERKEKIVYSSEFPRGRHMPCHGSVGVHGEVPRSVIKQKKKEEWWVRAFIMVSMERSG